MITRTGRHLAFLIGPPRSGTTLLSVLLGRSPQAYCPPELWLALPATRLGRTRAAVHHDDSDAALAYRAISAALGESVLHDLEARALVAAYNRVAARKPEVELLVDKTPRYYKIVPELASLFSNARFVLLVRDPRDIAASWKTSWKADLQMLATPEGVRDDSYDVFCAPALMLGARELLGDRAHWLRYEDLVAEPETELRAVCEFLELEYSDALLDYHADPELVALHKASALGDQEIWRRDAIDGASIGRWREVLSVPELERVTACVGPAVFEALGYEPSASIADDPEARDFLSRSLRASLAGADGAGSSAEVVSLRASVAGLDAEVTRWHELYEGAEAQRDRALDVSRRAQEARDGDRELRLREARQKRHWKDLFHRAETDRDAERAARVAEGQEKFRWRELFTQSQARVKREQDTRLAEAREKEHWNALFHESEGQLESERRLRADAETQREQVHGEREREADAKRHWRDLYVEIETQRDAESELRGEESLAREHWQRLYEEAETQRDTERDLRGEESLAREHWQGLYGEAETQRDDWAERAQHFEQDLAAARADLYRLNTLWPWLESTRAEQNAGLPRISVVTPSFNQAQWIEETIRSVLEQGYPNFEHIVVDAGSSDRTAEVVSRYPHVRFVQEPDRGQAHAINKGLLMATGEILAYLNSDDLYRPGAFYKVAAALGDATKAMVAVGACDYVDERGEVSGRLVPMLNRYSDLLRYWGWDRWYCIPQQSTFWRREVLSVTGLFNVDFQYTMDYEMWLRMAAHFPFEILDDTLAAFRMHPESKTVSNTWKMYLEERRASRRYWPSWWRWSRLHLEAASLRHIGRKLLDVAEHEALALGLRRHSLKLLVLAVRHWPPVAVSPRGLLTALTALAIGTPITRPAALLHRAWLGLLHRILH